MENRRNLKLAGLYFLLTALLLFLIFKFGLLAAVKISEVLQGNKPLPETETRETILTPPRFYPIKEATSSATLIFSGYAPIHSEVDIYLNSLNVKTLTADSEGLFNGDLSLSLGTNEVYAIAKDKNGVESSPSQTWPVFYNNQPPFLEILEPTKGTLIKKEKMVTLKGKTAKTSRIYVNDHLVQIDTEGLFNYPVELKSGENKIKIISVDPAQNRAEIEWILNFQP